MSLRILAPGPLALVEDHGRPGYAAVGVGRSGAMDRGALRLANRLLGNPPGAAALELLGQPASPPASRPRLDQPHRRRRGRALDGAALDRVLPALAPAGCGPAVRPPEAGLRRTLGVRGGIAARPRARLPLPRHALRPRPGPPPRRRPARRRRARRRGPPPRLVALRPAPRPGLRVLPGPRLDLLPPGTWQRLLAGPWRVSPSADRVGLRLAGTPLPTGGAPELPSEGLVHGSIQLPPSGLPVVFGPDHPTTGGYPVIAVVAAPSLDTLAHLTPGAEVHLHA